MKLVLAMFWVAAFADWWTTTRALRHGGSEANPFVRLVMRLPWETEVELAALKVVGFVAMLWLGVPLSLWWWFVGLQFAAAAWNGWLLHRAGLLR